MLIIRSKTEEKLLTYFFLNQSAEHHLHEIARMLKTDPANLDKKIKKLEKAGVFQSRRRGNQKIYFLNHKFPLYSEYKSIINKIYGVEHILKKTLCGIPGIQRAYIFGSYATNKFDAFSDIDLLVIGHHDSLELTDALTKIEEKIGREINPVEIDPEEFKQRFKTDFFLKNIFKQIVQFI